MTYIEDIYESIIKKTLNELEKKGYESNELLESIAEGLLTDKFNNEDYIKNIIENFVQGTEA